MSIKQLVGKFHLWVGLIIGMIIFIVSITGCIYAFSYDIKSFLHKDRHEVSVPENSEKLPLNNLLTIASKKIPEDVPCSMTYVPTKEDEAVVFHFMKLDREAFLYSNYMQFYKTVSVNPYTGEVIYVENTKWDFFTINFWLHISLLLGHLGLEIVVVATWFFIGMLLSGLVLWWPSKRGAKNKFLFRWKKNTARSKKNYDIHQIVGFYVIPFAILFTLTGLFWGSKGLNKFARNIVNGSKQIEKPYYPVSDTTFRSTELPLDKIYNTSLSLFPETNYVLIKGARNKLSPLVVRANNKKQEYKRFEYFFDQYSGELLHQVQFKDKNNGDKLAALNYDLHAGGIGGLTTKIIAFLASLCIASLTVTGFIIWYRRQKKKKQFSEINWDDISV